MNALSFLSFHACNTEDFQDFLTRIDLFYFVIIIDQRLVLYCSLLFTATVHSYCTVEVQY